VKTRILSLIILVLTYACKENVATKPSKNVLTTSITYAKGFELSKREGYTLLTIKTPYPNSAETYQFALVPKNQNIKPVVEGIDLDGIIETPVARIVVTSTTHIPSLDMLGTLSTLVGFPNTEYISSPTARAAVDKGSIVELGQNEAINTELTIDLNPEVVVAFGVDNKSSALTTVARAGIPILYNGDWVEQHPLGKAEWIKFFGALYDKQDAATAIFNDIENEYLAAKKLALTTEQKPTVLSGAMYKDVWYLPYGNSWAGQLIKDANAKYLWGDTKGSGSISLSIEAVIEKGQTADFWIAPGQYASYTDLTNANPVYKEFDAFKNKKIYNYAEAKGATGGMLYYELAPNRPDLVLKDIVYHLHPDVLKDYTPTFFTSIRE